MCRLFGMSAGSVRTHATFWLLDAPDSLSAQSYREPDGTGLGWFDEGGRPHVAKQPLAAHADRDFAQEAREVCSETFIAHIRFASTGGLDARNTHPFEQEGRLFAHNGVIEGLDELERELGEDRRLVRGDTDSERFFALITREIAACGGDVRGGVATACRWVAAELPLFAINFVLAEADGLWALRYPETHELFVLERRSDEPLEHGSTLGTHVRSAEAGELPVVVIASERMDDDHGWRALRSGELIHVDASLHVQSEVLLDQPPAHPLTLADLGDVARRSQAAPAPVRA